MENITLNTNNSSYNDTDLLFNSYYNSSYNDSNLLFDIYYDSLYNSSNPTFELHDNFLPNPMFELYDPLHDDFSNLFLGDLDETQIENETMDIIAVSSENNAILRRDREYDNDNNVYDSEKGEEEYGECGEDQEKHNDNDNECE